MFAFSSANLSDVPRSGALRRRPATSHMMLSSQHTRFTRCPYIPLPLLLPHCAHGPTIHHNPCIGTVCSTCTSTTSKLSSHLAFCLLCASRCQQQMPRSSSERTTLSYTNWRQHIWLVAVLLLAGRARLPRMAAARGCCQFAPGRSFMCVLRSYCTAMYCTRSMIYFYMWRAAPF
jgi:hypothetical protein